MTKKAKATLRKTKSKRIHLYTFLLNEEENKALKRYLSKYKITNKAKLIRESLMITVIKKLESDHPTLFDFD